MMKCRKSHPTISACKLFVNSLVGCYLHRECICPKKNELPIRLSISVRLFTLVRDARPQLDLSFQIQSLIKHRCIDASSSIVKSSTAFVFLYSYHQACTCPSRLNVSSSRDASMHPHFSSGTDASLESAPA